MLDAFAREGDARAGLAARSAAWRDAVAALERTRMDDRERRARIEMAAFQLQEIDKVAPTAGEDDRLAAERLVLANADRLSRLSAEAFGVALRERGCRADDARGRVEALHELANLDARFAPFVAQRDVAQSRARRSRACSCGRTPRSLDASPERLQAVEDRLATLERVKRKHGPSLADVLARQESLRRELAELEGGEGHADALRRASARRATTFHDAARALSARRHESGRRLAQGARGRTGRAGDEQVPRRRPRDGR